MDSARSRHKVKWNWLKGHSGHDGNERCDLLANEAIAKIKKTFTPEQLKAALAEFVSNNEGGQSRADLLGD